MKLLLLGAALVGDVAAFGSFSTASKMDVDGSSSCGKGELECCAGETCAQSDSFSIDDLVVDPIATYLATTVPEAESACGCDQAGVHLACALDANSNPRPPPSTFLAPPSLSVVHSRRHARAMSAQTTSSFATSKRRRFLTPPRWPISSRTLFSSRPSQRSR